MERHNGAYAEFRISAVLGDLADLRYDARWIGLPASAVGAPHPRFRIFILAHRAVPDTACLRLGLRRGDARSGEGQAWNDRIEPSGDRPRDMEGPAFFPRSDVRGHRGLLRRWGRYAPAIARWERITGSLAPTPAILNEAKGPRPAPDSVEWLMGLDRGWVTDPALKLTPAQQLTALGNGVVPLQAARALQHLASVGSGVRSQD